MRFAAPGGEMTGWSAVALVFGIVYCGMGMVQHHPMLVAFGMTVAMPCAGIWLGLRWCGYYLAGVVVLLSLLAMARLVWVEESILERMTTGIKILASLYFAKTSFVWARHASMAEESELGNLES